MENTFDRGAPHALRLFLIGVLTALGFAALSLVLSVSSASADDGSQGGLLGTVGSTVGQVTDTVDEVVGTVVAPTVEHVTETVAPVTDVAPAPVAEVVTTTTDTVSDVVDTAETAVGSTVDTVADTVTEVAGSGVVGDVVAPVVDTVQTVPVVGDVAHAIGLDDLLSGVTAAVDAALPVIIGTLPPISTTVPTLPVDGGEVATPSPDAVTAELFSAAAVVAGPASTDPSPTASPLRTSGSADVAALFAAAPTGGASAALAGAQKALSGLDLDTDHGVALGSSTGTSSSASGNSGAGGVSAATADSGRISAAQLLLDRRTVVDDDLPGTPVFATDVSPD